MLRRTVVRCLQQLPPTTHEPQPYEGPPASEILERRRRFLHPVSPMFYPEDPLALVEGKMQYVWDDCGKRYLDFYGGVVTTSVGHCHPRVAEAAKRQMDRIWHTTSLYLNDVPNQFAEYLVGKMPGDPDDWVVYLLNSGGEATEFAMFSARMYTKNHNYVTLRNGYHGIGSQGTRGATASRGWRWAVPDEAGTRHALCPNLYNGAFTGPGAMEKYLGDLRGVMAETCSSVAAFAAENVQGVGGVVELPKGYAKEAYRITREAGGVCVSDEVQTGFGRLGDCYWGFQKDGEEAACPDMVVCAKSVGNGWPLSAVVCRRGVAEALKGASYFNTFGGNPVAAAVGLETLRVLDDTNSQENCRVLGGILTAGLRSMASRRPSIGDVRGRGLMLGVELSHPGTTDPVPPAFTANVVSLLRNRQVLVGRGGPGGNVLRLKPPMCVTAADCEYLLEQLNAVLGEVEQSL